MNVTTPTSTVERVLRTLDGVLAAGGWDQPHWLAYVASGADETSRLSELGPTASLLPVTGTDLTIYLTTLGRCDAYEALLGRSAPAWAKAAVLAIEAWMAPPTKAGNTSSHVAPSEHPDRIEMRLLTWVGRSGSVHALGRSRNEEQELTAPNTLGGRLVDALRRVMGRTVEPVFPVTAYAARVFADLFAFQVAAGSSAATSAIELQKAYEADPLDSWSHVTERLRHGLETPSARTLAAWMGTGMAANELVSGLPTVAWQLATLEHTAGVDAAAALRAVLDEMGLDDGSRATDLELAAR